VVAVPAVYVADVMEECGQKGIKALIIISSGFKEVGNADLEQKILFSMASVRQGQQVFSSTSVVRR
jgi:acyl-CoA synthetase (NDP forming)